MDFPRILEELPPNSILYHNGLGLFEFYENDRYFEDGIVSFHQHEFETFEEFIDRIVS